MTRRHVSFALISVLAAITLHAQPSGCSAMDETAIRKLAADFDAASKTHDAAKYAAAFADNVDWENAFGDHTSGRDQLASGMASVMKTFRTAEETVTAVHVSCMRPDLALVDIYQTISGQKTGADIVPDRHIRLTQIYEKGERGWTIRAHRVADLREKRKKNRDK